MELKTALGAALKRGWKMFAIAFVAAATTGVSAFQQNLLQANGSLNYKAASAAACTASLIAFATSALHLLERSLGDSSENENRPPPPLSK